MLTENASVSNLVYTHYNRNRNNRLNYFDNSHSGDAAFQIEVVDSEVYGHVIIAFKIINRDRILKSDVHVTMSAILGMVDSMLFASLGTIPSLNPCGFQGFEIDDYSYRHDDIIMIEIGQKGFDRERLIRDFKKVLSPLY